MLLRSFEHTTDPAVRETVRALLADEVRHGQLGWAYLEQVAPAARTLLGPRLPTMLAATVREEVFASTERFPHPTEALRYGKLPLATRIALFQETVEDVVFPGFERSGIPTAEGRAWLRAGLSRWRAGGP